MTSTISPNSESPFFQFQTNGSAHSIPGDQESENPQSSHPHNTKHVLIVEDDRVSVLYIKELVGMMEVPGIKIKVDHVFTGEKALEHIHNQYCDLVLMDLKLPGIDGLETTRLIKSKHPSLPVIAQTAFALSGDDQKALQAGCDDYISKPIADKELTEKIRSHLGL